MTLLADRHGRQFPYLRLSLLDACNFRCSYCLPEGYHGCGTQGVLGLDEIRRLLAAFACVGLRKLRLTGGEPTLRRDLLPIIELAAATPGLERLAMTTNGILLEKRSADWRAAGLDALNISLDSLDAARFEAITGSPAHASILRGIESSLRLGFASVKLNAVLLRGLNDDELPSWLDYLRERPVSVRFIELMQTGDNAEYFSRHHLRAEALEAQLGEAGWVLQPRPPTAGPAREYAHPDFAGRIGVIAPYSKDFCAGCNRLRVTATGDLRLCLFGEFGIPLRPLLQDDADREALVGRLTGQLALKTAGHGLHEGHTGLTPHLASIGG
ncbi:GTP 3',8-cyclase MoaA [Pseudomarimonas salicorniae]|uniref:GTP 3',8-cyclase n=1 Tax=Pseudomarimonas salicorniae TaxID=2933270 RepID=A0ABT0GF66_9GAMM|nr:GTP 3',8-cyclase MoaA [Lysobacter sp. CAU 1642]MCK7593185.1 GTP 3',8-cyclase MoaA [Lysobacter sp. CAU 1642]